MKVVIQHQLIKVENKYFRKEVWVMKEQTFIHIVSKYTSFGYNFEVLEDNMSNT